MTTDPTGKYLVIQSSSPANYTNYLSVYSIELNNGPVYSIVLDKMILPLIWVPGTECFTIHSDRELMLACLTNSNLTISSIVFPYKVVSIAINAERDVVAVLVGTEEDITNRTIYLLKLSQLRQ